MARGPLAGAAGPGKFSKRTDMTLPSASYGEGVETAALQAGAPLAKTASVNPMSRSEQGIAPSQLERVTPLYAPTERADEPITAGIALGAGPGPEALGINAVAPRQKQSDILVKLLPFDDTGEITILYQEALARGN
jgi:hypothetical protein